MIPTQFASKLREMMDEKRWNIFALSQASGVSETKISSYLYRGSHPMPETLSKIAMAFGVTMEIMMGEEATKA